MASWLWIAIAAQFLAAISVLIDKHIVVRAAHIGRPIVYAFYVSLLSGFVVVLLSFGVVHLPSQQVLIHSFLSAVAFTGAIYCLYSALRLARASDVAPAVGGVSAITAVLAAALVIEGDVSPSFILPVLLLAVGTAVISHFHFKRVAIVYIVFSGVGFGLMAFFFKLVFLETTFFDGFFWPRAMNVGVALALLAMPAVRQAVFHGTKQSSPSSKGLVIGNKVVGGVSAALTALAISIGPVSVVNALAGLQFVFLFLFAVLFARHMPLFSAEKTGSHGGWHTLAGVVLICSGLAWLAYVH